MTVAWALQVEDKPLADETIARRGWDLSWFDQNLLPSWTDGRLFGRFCASRKSFESQPWGTWPGSVEYGWIKRSTINILNLKAIEAHWATTLRPVQATHHFAAGRDFLIHRSVGMALSCLILVSTFRSHCHIRSRSTKCFEDMWNITHTQESQIYPIKFHAGWFTEVYWSDSSFVFGALACFSHYFFSISAAL